MIALKSTRTEKRTSKKIQTAPAGPTVSKRGPKSAKEIPKVRPLRDYLPSPTKDYVLDCEAGYLCARELLAEIARRERDDRDLLGAMVLVMIEHRYHQKALGVLVGFMAEISRRIPLRPWDQIIVD